MWKANWSFLGCRKRTNVNGKILFPPNHSRWLYKKRHTLWSLHHVGESRWVFVCSAIPILRFSVFFFFFFFYRHHLLLPSYPLSLSHRHRHYHHRFEFQTPCLCWIPIIVARHCYASFKLSLFLKQDMLSKKKPTPNRSNH